MSLFNQIDRRVKEVRQTVRQFTDEQAGEHSDFVCRACGESYAEERDVCGECGMESVERVDDSR